jgi:hypothetical protein
MRSSQHRFRVGLANPSPNQSLPQLLSRVGMDCFMVNLRAPVSDPAILRHGMGVVDTMLVFKGAEGPTAYTFSAPHALFLSESPSFAWVARSWWPLRWLDSGFLPSFLKDCRGAGARRMFLHYASTPPRGRHSTQRPRSWQPFRAHSPIQCKRRRLRACATGRTLACGSLADWSLARARIGTPPHI